MTSPMPMTTRHRQGHRLPWERGEADTAKNLTLRISKGELMSRLFSSKKGKNHSAVIALIVLTLGIVCTAAWSAADARSAASAKKDYAPLPVIPNADADTAEEMKPYTEIIPGTGGVKIEMVPIPGGVFTMGSSSDSKYHKKDEGPQHRVKVDPFWMSKYEITWNAYEQFMLKLDIKRRKHGLAKPTKLDDEADAVARPTPPYTDMTFGMGRYGYPAVSMTQHAAKTFTKWLSKKTGRFYRLPSEAEWEYACRAGSETAWYFGNDMSKLGKYAWFFGNSLEPHYHPVGTKKPNAWGLYDMHGNVWEYVIDQYDPNWYEQFAGKTVTWKEHINWPTKPYFRVVRGGSWNSSALETRSASRWHSSPVWKIQDPQRPKSIWYHTEARWTGFRIIRPLHEPSQELKDKFWNPQLPKVKRIQKRQQNDRGY